MAYSSTKGCVEITRVTPTNQNPYPPDHEAVGKGKVGKRIGNLKECPVIEESYSARSKIRQLEPNDPVSMILPPFIPPPM